MRPNIFTLTLVVLLGLIFCAPPEAAADRSGWNETSRAPGYADDLLRINVDYFNLSAATGGDFYFWAPGEFASNAGLLNVPIASEPIALAYAVADGPFTQALEIPVDGALTRLSLFAGAQRLDTLELLRPDGRSIEANPTGVEIQGFQHMQLVTVVDPEPGVWQAKLCGAGAYELSSRYLAEHSKIAPKGLKGIDLIGFDFVELRGRPGHQGLFPVEEPPAAGSTQLCRVTVSGGISQITFALVSATDDVHEEVHIESSVDASSDEFIGRCRVPNQPFRVRVRGEDTEGWPFQRVTAGLFTPAE